MEQLTSAGNISMLVSGLSLNPPLIIRPALENGFNVCNFQFAILNFFTILTITKTIWRLVTFETLITILTIESLNS